MMNAQIRKISGKSNVSTLNHSSFSEHVISVCGKNPEEMNSIINSTALDLDSDILSRFVFAGIKHYGKFSENVLVPEGRIVWLQGDACTDADVYSMQAFSVSGVNLKTVKYKSHEIGFCYEDDNARYCRLSDITPENLKASKKEQTEEVFKIIDASLSSCGFKFTDTVRTWFYLDKLLSWYKEFNDVRTEFFEKSGIFSKMVPASTGIGAANHSGAALTCDLLAVQPKNNKVKIHSVSSPMQNPALNYRSSFSRAVEVVYPEFKELFISGTASIDPDGKSVFIDDCERQVDLTMRVVDALLASRAMSWKDVSRGIAYFKNINDKKFYAGYCKKHSIPSFPLAVAHVDICRGDLLFEIEIDAAKTN